MSDMSPVIVPKSDQINADDLLSGPRTIRITSVKVAPGTEQPVQVHFEGDDGKPFRPCKSMCRVMVNIWGPDSSAYAGKSMTLYRDPKVKWGGLEVGGIRISHMSDMESQVVMALTETRASRKPFTVKPLPKGAAPTGDREKAETWLAAYLANPVDNAANQRALAKLEKQYPDLYAQTQKPPPADDWATGPADEQSGGRDFQREAADRLITDTKACDDPAGLGFMGNDLEAYNNLTDELRAEVDAAVETRRGELVVPA